MKFSQVYLLLSALTVLSMCDGYRILAVFPLNAKSHNIVYEAIAKGLAKRGHQIDVVSHFPLKKPMKNYNDIVNLDGSLENLVNNFTFTYIKFMSNNILDAIGNVYGNRICQFLGFEEMQKLIKNPPNDPPYDVILTEAFGASCYFGLGYVFKVPVVALSSAGEYPWISDYMGNDENLAYAPNAFHVGAGKMTFFQRFKNWLVNFMALRTFYALTEEIQTGYMRRYLSPDIPNIREVEKNVSLTLVNSNPIIFGVKPITPALVQIAGIHIEENDETLSPELEKWMNKSTDGVIYFTFGSMVLIETLPVALIKEMYDVFSKLAPMRVLIKIANATNLPPGLPKNVKGLPWIPQQPVLAHPNTKLFITHGGLGGLEEALYYGIPMIAVPLFGDQPRNVEAFAHKKMVLRIEFDSFSGATLESAIKTVLTNPTYKQNAVYYSKLFRDQPLSPMNNAVFWIEYVIRNGGNVMKSPALELTWWQLALFDIYAVVVSVFILVSIIIILTIRLLLKKFIRNDASIKKKKTR